MSDSIQLQFYSNHNGNLFGEITDDHIRAIVERAQSMGLLDDKLQLPAPRDPMPEIKFDPPPFDKPAAPADDEATVEGMVLALARDKRDSSHSGIAKVLLAAIRRGEVPGLTTTVERDDAIRQAAQAQDKVVDLEAEVERLSQVWKSHAAMAHEAFTQRDTAIARAEKAEREAQAWKEEAEDNEADAAAGEQACIQRDAAVADFKLMQAQRDEQALEAVSARAAHAEAMETIKDVTTWAEGLIRQLPAGHNGRDSWLLNFGHGPDVEEMRDKHPTYRAKYGKDASK